MIILGSNGVLQARYRTVGESDVLLLDISNDSEYLWTTSFDPTPLTSSPPIVSKPKTNNRGIIVGLSIGVIVIIGILLLGVLFFIRRRKIHKSEKPIPTPGTDINNEEIITIPSGYELSHKRPIL
jgi:hypothetical protein